MSRKRGEHTITSRRRFPPMADLKDLGFDLPDGGHTPEGRSEQIYWIPAPAPGSDPGSSGMTYSRQAAANEPPVDSIRRRGRMVDGRRLCVVA